VLYIALAKEISLPYFLTYTLYAIKYIQSSFKAN
jgi:hypothetical protein